MSIVNYLSVDFDVSPRIIWIDTNVSTSISVQNLIDTCSHLSASVANMDDAILLESSGKEYLTEDGSVKVGLTVTLNNVKIGFQSLGGPDWILCSIEGGNVVAVEDIYTSPRVYTDVIHPTAYISIERVSSSSATLSELTAIQYASFGGGITVDIINGVSGIKFPIGTIEQPVNNIPDAVLIANGRGLNKIFIIGDITFSTGDDLDDFSVFGESPIKSLITIESAALVAGTEFSDAQIIGVLDGNNTIKNCKVGNLIYVEGYIQECLLEAGTIVLGGSTRCDFLNCWSGSSGVTPVIDMGGSGRALGMRAYSGGVKIINKNGNEKVAIDLISGYLILDATVTAGEITARGVGNLTDNSTGTVIVNDGLLSQECIADSVWNKDLSNYTSGAAKMQQAQMFGKEVVIDANIGVAGTDFPTGTRSQPVNNLTDALAICAERGLLRIMTRTSLTVEAGHNVDEISFATHGIMGTQIIFQEGCSANKVTIRYASVSGVITLGDMMLIESCQVGNLANFTGILNLVSFSEGCEISVGSWANMIDCYCGGEPTNEPEINIGTSALSITCYCGNLKLTNKTGGNRTIASFRSGSVSIASSCIAGKIQILGTGQLEKDESGPGCQVDVDAALTNEFIADHVWDESMSNHTVSGTTGKAINDTIENVLDINTTILRNLGLSQENYYLDQTVYVTYQGAKLLTGGRIRVYSDAVSVGTDSNIIATYIITATWIEDKLQTYKVVKQ